MRNKKAKTCLTCTITLMTEMSVQCLCQREHSYFEHMTGMTGAWNLEKHKWINNMDQVEAKQLCLKGTWNWKKATSEKTSTCFSIQILPVWIVHRETMKFLLFLLVDWTPVSYVDQVRLKDDHRRFGSLHSGLGVEKTLHGCWFWLGEVEKACGCVRM